MGEFYAAACAVMWAFAVIFFRKSGLTVPPLALNLYRVGVSVVFFLTTLAVRGRPLLVRAPWTDYLILMASGVLAIAVADTLFHMSLNRVGAGINAIVDSLYSPFTVFFAFVMLDERLSAWDFGGMGLIVGAVILASRVALPEGVRRRALVAGVLLGVASMAFLGFGIVLAKPVLERSDVLWATTVRQLGALLALAPAAVLRRDRAAVWGVFRPQAAWRFALPGTLFGSYLSLLLWIAGMKYTRAGPAAILNQTSTIYILLLATVFLHEPFTRRKAGACLLAVGGMVLVIRPWACPG